PLRYLTETTRTTWPLCAATAFRALAMEHVDPTKFDAIRAHLQRRHAYGTDRFPEMIDRQPCRRASSAKIGWPRKADRAHRVENTL
ncbi:MAG: hypothetical protein ABIR16_00215, partial [Dokdonella sp.]